MSSLCRESTRAFRWLMLPLLTVGAFAAAAFAAPADHLIISEVVVTTRTPVTDFGSPFIEIVNPTGAAIPMDNVYLTDGTTAPATFYYKITLLDPEGAKPGGGVGGDFHARFPAGFTLAAGDSIAIAINGSEQYEAAYGRKPDFELFEDGSAPDAVPEMWEAFPGSIGAGLGGTGNVPVLTGLAESLVLYTWDGTSDLVQDLDYVLWGSLESVRFDKTGVTVGGATYLADTPVGSQQAAATSGPSYGEALMRPDSDEGTETTTGGNGPTGHNESSENLATTFPTVVGQEPPLANPSFPAGPIVTTGGIAPVAPVDGQAVVLSITAVDQDEVESAMFYYAINGGAYQTVSGAPSGPGEWSATVPAQVENTLVAWYAVATNTESTTAIYPAGSPNFASKYSVGPAVIPGDGPAKLLLTEISTTGNDQEYIEIYNPGAGEVDLSDYYLTDAIRVSSTQLYWRIAEPNPTQPTIGGGAYFDFTARFPDGYKIAAGDTIVVSLPGSGVFSATFGFDPDLEMYEDGSTADGVPDMRYVFGDATNNSIINRTGTADGQPSTPGLTNGGETVVLYHWVTGEDKVVDIDIFAWKDPGYGSTSYFFSKTGQTIGSHSYLSEQGTGVATAYGSEATFGNSYHRSDPNETGQIASGSNGVDGRDETSENFQNNFELKEYDPSAPSGSGPGPVDPSKLLITQVCAVGTGAEFIEIHNPGAAAVNMAGYYLTDAVYAPGNQLYWQIALGNPTGATVGGGAFGDFHAKFPSGYSLAAGDTITVSVSGGSAFNSVYGYFPDLKLYEDDADDDNVPVMDYIFGDASNNSIINQTGTGSGQPSSPGLTDAAETVVLYHWNTGQDKVVDIDVFFWKDALATEESFLFSKTGVTVGAHAYSPDTATGSQTPFNSETDPGFAYHRTDANEGTQITSGSNGVGGRDETSENFNGTFGMMTADPARPTAPPDPGDYPPKLLLTEITTLGTDQEFVEIYNPNNEPVDLSDYYLTDAIYSTGNQYYWRIAEGNPNVSTVGGGAYFDFHARFPDGFTIGAGAVIVVSIPGSSQFEASFGFKPDLELFEDGEASDSVPDMRYVFGDDVNNSIVSPTGTGAGQPSTPGLTNGGETVILYHWDGIQDRVVDIDVFAYKDPSYATSSFFFNKTGQTVGSHSYLPEQGTNENVAYGEQAGFGNSYQRIDASEGAQTPTGSNGVLGRDETSEDFRNTFTLEAYDPGFYNPGGGPGPDPETGIILNVPARTYVPTLDNKGFPITFAAPPSTESETRLRIFDRNGRLVITLFDSRFDGDPPGDTGDRRNPMYWDARDATFEMVKAGMFVAHLSVVSIQTGNEEIITAPVVIGTRLSN